ncbi:SIMPL domain-containing protein [Pseudarthrobacter raffinosi]|uniref:SIMPL domain-containing protein n=1 Tax=Pseudarthrobacter raffinosi TaxID=2953651 RepID=UPI00208E01D7|nr:MULTISPECIES: SIMPL domain-containing protein [unclassified Pseudarthrobacter]MCO4252853.1 SIMPL domain-containing protein [Pseudarthrobacter sp. MDT3-9]MCO4262048.1 SIMPL domain-containing protein [Pseudarthrobacter sp. MDT3-26]
MTGEPNTTTSNRTIIVTGTGTAEAPPDLLTISVGVECRRDSVGAAYADAGTASAAVSGALRRHGLADTDIRTSGLNVRPEFVWRDSGGQQVTGYVTSSMLTVRLRQVSAASAVIAAAVDAGGDDVRLNGLELGFSDESAVAALARDAAWQDASVKAEQFASLASARLGAVMSVAEHPDAPGPVPVARIQRAAASEAISVEAGHAGINASVTVVWELLD